MVEIAVEAHSQSRFSSVKLATDRFLRDHARELIETALAFFGLKTRLHRGLRIPADAKFSWGTSLSHGLVHSSHLLKATDYPIGDIAAHRFHIVCADMLYAAFVVREKLQLAARAVDGLVIALVRILERDLPILRTVGDEVGHRHILHMACEKDARHEFHELVQRLFAPNPHHVVPIMRHWTVAFACEATTLQIAPIVVGAPGDAELEALLVTGGAWRVLAAERPTHHADAIVIHIRALLQIVNRGTCPTFAVVNGEECFEPKCLANARLVDHQNRNAAHGFRAQRRSFNQELSQQKKGWTYPSLTVPKRY
jgi:hypothetical protein